MKQPEVKYRYMMNCINDQMDNLFKTVSINPLLLDVLYKDIVIK